MAPGPWLVAAAAALSICAGCRAEAPEPEWRDGAFALSATPDGCALSYRDPDAPDLRIAFQRENGNFTITANGSAWNLPGRTLPASLGNGATLVTGQAAVADNGHSFALSPPDPYLLHELLAEGQNNRGTLTLAHGEFHAVMPLDERFADGWGRLESCLAGLPR